MGRWIRSRYKCRLTVEQRHDELAEWLRRWVTRRRRHRTATIARRRHPLHDVTSGHVTTTTTTSRRHGERARATLKLRVHDATGCTACARKHRGRLFGVGFHPDFGSADPTTFEVSLWTRPKLDARGPTRPVIGDRKRNSNTENQRRVNWRRDLSVTGRRQKRSVGRLWS